MSFNASFCRLRKISFFTYTRCSLYDCLYQFLCQLFCGSFSGSSHLNNKIRRKKKRIFWHKSRTQRGWAEGKKYICEWKEIDTNWLFQLFGMPDKFNAISRIMEVQLPSRQPVRAKGEKPKQKMLLCHYIYFFSVFSSCAKMRHM